jgi:hypothetical protein
MVTVKQPGDDCATPQVIPAAGPFPYTLTADLSAATLQGSDPMTCNITPSASARSVWLSFTPGESGLYYLSTCASRDASVAGIFTGDACGPYTAVDRYSSAFDACFLDLDPESDCFADFKEVVQLVAGTTYRIQLFNYVVEKPGQVSLTVARTTAFTPVVAWASPASGQTAGATSVVITGSGFSNGATVTIGGVATTSVTYHTPNLLTAITGAHAAGTVDVVVTNPGGANARVGGGFTYTPTVMSAPANLVAAAASTSTVNLTWGAVPFAASYAIDRREAGAGYVSAGTSATNSKSDPGRTANRSYLYRVHAVGPYGEISPDSNLDAATTTIFTDDPLVAPSTPVKALHVVQARTAVLAMRDLAGIGTFSFTDDPLSTGVKAVHVVDLRTALDQARATLSLPPLVYTNNAAAGQLIRAVHLTEVRYGVK